MRSPRGFTLVEVIVVFALVAILAGLGTWQMNRLRPRYRANAAANQLVMDVRKASAIAVRTNRPVILTVNPAGCAPGYVIASSEATYEKVCFATEYAGVVYRVDEGGISCPRESALNYPPLPACSLCSVDEEKTFRFLPNGEVITPSGGDESIVIGPRDDSTSFDRAVGVRNATGKARVYTRVGDGWDCP